MCYTFFAKQLRVNCFNILKDSDINMGSFFYKIIMCEMARLQTWEITADLKASFQDSQKKLHNHSQATLGSVPTLMLPGNQARVLFLEENASGILGLIEDHERRNKLAEVLALFRRVRTMYRATHPKQDEVRVYKTTAIEMGQLPRHHFSYMSWPNYLHKLIEHVQEVLQDPLGPGSVGGLSSEGNEAANKFFRDLRKNFSLQNSTTQSLRDILWFHWLYTSPKLRRIGAVTSRKTHVRSMVSLVLPALSSSISSI